MKALSNDDGFSGLGQSKEAAPPEASLGARNGLEDPIAVGSGPTSAVAQIGHRGSAGPWIGVLPGTGWLCPWHPCKCWSERRRALCLGWPRAADGLHRSLKETALRTLAESDTVRSLHLHAARIRHGDRPKQAVGSSQLFRLLHIQDLGRQFLTAPCSTAPCKYK